jgi:hypothetical protein
MTTISDLVTEARSDLLNDTVADYLWSTEQLTRYANEGITEACKRAPLITRAKTLTVTSGLADYVLDSAIRQVYRAKLNLATRPLLQTTDVILSLQHGTSYQTHTGTPTHFVRHGHKLRLYPIPLVDDTLRIDASCLPDDDFDLDEDIDAGCYPAIVLYIAHKAFSLRDMDSYDPVKSQEYLNRFNAFFGQPKTARFDSFSQDNPMYATATSGRMC